MDFFKKSEGRVIAILIIIALAIWSLKTGFDALYSFKSTQQFISTKTITVGASDKALGKPDIGQMTISVVSNGRDVATVTKDSNTKMNAITTGIKAMQVSADDIKTTSYSLHPQYDYTDSDAGRITGYTLEQSLEVKVRKLDQVGAIVQKSTELGANQISNLNLVIDNMDQLQSEARAKAFTKAKEKAQTLADQAGVRLGNIISFSEDSNGGGYPTPMYNAYDMKATAESVPAPNFETGSTEVHANVSVTYEIY
jgi:uncharacterized protein YggE